MTSYIMTLAGSVSRTMQRCPFCLAHSAELRFCIQQRHDDFGWFLIDEPMCDCCVWNQARGGAQLKTFRTEMEDSVY